MRGRFKAAWKVLRGHPTIYGLREAYLVFPQRERAYEKSVEIVDCPDCSITVNDSAATVTFNGDGPHSLEGRALTYDKATGIRAVDSARESLTVIPLPTEVETRQAV